MTKEYRISTVDLNVSADPDCYLDPADPVYQMTDNLLHKHNLAMPSEQPHETWEDKYAREHNIRPGTPAWHALRQSK